MIVSYLENRDGKQVFKISGEITASNSAEFSAELQKCREEHPDGGLILELGEMKYISSAGLRVMMTLSQRESEKVVLINSTDETKDILEDTGFTNIFEVS